MSTEYVLWTDGPVTLSAVESSARLSIDIFDERSPLQEVVVEQLDSDAVLQIVVKLLEAASYISEDPEQTIARLHKAITQHSKSYLGSMLMKIVGPRSQYNPPESDRYR